MAEIDFDTEDTDDTRDQRLQGAFDDEPKKLFTKKRLVIAGIVLGVFALTAMMWSSKADEKPTAAQSSQLTPIQSSAPVEKAKKNKKVKYKPLYSQLTSEKLSAIIRELSHANMTFDTAQNGKNFTILVDQDEMEEARILLAMKGLPDGGAKGYELLDDTDTLGVTEFDKRIRFLRAMSGELEKAIIQFSAIETCKVQIVLPEQRLFAVSRPPVTASILIRATSGYTLTDDVVFSIIQLVSKAVENLQPENVSVIDTEGNVLSSGIFERISTRVVGSEKEARLEEDPTLQFEQGTPILPDIKSINDWLAVKKTFEQGLEDKAIRQLLGLLPMKSFKLAITSDVGAVEDGKVLDVKRLNVSIVLDNNNPDIFLDEYLKEEIFNTIAPSIGYVRGRDNIILSKADFLTFSDAELERLNRLKSPPLSILGTLKKYGPWALGAGVLLMAINGIKKWRKNRRESTVLNEVDEDNPDFNLSVMSTQNVARINDIATTNPEWIASVLEDWIATPSADLETDDEFSFDEEEATLNA